MTCRRIAVLMGGLSAERDVSLNSGRNVAEALRGLGHDVRCIDAGADLLAIVRDLRDYGPDAVFNALHGRLGEDGAIQGVLDWMGIAYTHSGVRASATAMDKDAARTVFAAAGLPVATGMLLTPAELEPADPLPAPYVVKPVNEGSSVGVEIVHAGSNRRGAIARGWSHGPHVLVEEYIPGRELTVGVLDDRALTVTDITPAASGPSFYDYEAKYAAGGSRHELPARIHPAAFARACDLALAAHRALGCRGASRTDFRYDDTAGAEAPGRLVILETNTQPGMTPTSLLPEQAAYCGMDYATLCQWMIDHATCRT
ncbi:D-alanine--D-alanine ligase [Komagataeibacter rhaeticus]|uniref:D-alanine--D-alanine ligase n=1 Tax=Komagataeibacter rhaeticus TaxID=215221 RepID=UPI0004D85D43|nr:D-alanine--D-alanine ligase [Komagataeibacter rhaeticus]KDU96796.1 D-alanine--D-alanine ligase [Komagataeibacter rhaeticus AF1]MBL7240189.1 D-alanine--D-alanine ligase [Komagataeibacter rhaeticus]PYD52804.1 D-alanine--D-alanine ligase [Komagataeibacter rhaeticus]GBQ10676.1 D-alanine--D-alanine ligase [Komagataeibacter rhaeticus DSM 16663]